MAPGQWIRNDMTQHQKKLEQRLRAEYDAPMHPANLEHLAIEAMHRVLRAHAPKGLMVPQLAKECGLGRGYVAALLVAMDEGRGFRKIGYYWREDFDNIEEHFRPKSYQGSVTVKKLPNHESKTRQNSSGRGIRRMPG